MDNVGDDETSRWSRPLRTETTWMNRTSFLASKSQKQVVKQANVGPETITNVQSCGKQIAV